jgi:hypothetical protein
MQKARNLPIYECLINKEWKESKMATIFISRKMPSGNFIVGLYMMDLACVGLKDTYYKFNLSLPEYEDFRKTYQKELSIIPINYALAHNIIYGGITFAEEFGFCPHKMFRITQYLLEEDDERIELIDIEFGENEMPLVIASQNNPQLDVITQLDASVGRKNYKII